MISKEHRAKINAALPRGKDHPYFGRPAWNKGKKMTAEQKKKIGQANGGRNHWAWIEDRTKLKVTDRRNDSAYKDWRRAVYLRDGFKCKIRNRQCSGKITAHHILGWASYPELRYEIKNGITLCQHHHPSKRLDEKMLAPKFQKLVKVKTL